MNQIIAVWILKMTEAEGAETSLLLRSKSILSFSEYSEIHDDVKLKPRFKSK